jgi:hypothetical protein
MAVLFVRGYGGGNKPDLVQCALLTARFGQEQMAEMNGVERTA